ncbi:MAG: beta-ketoacyl-ACP synthase II, partial [Gammaproteobacteria bacterium]|nr:beta-ketoacyl-ACP synthase II [Gammaproteobacteria bacterium]
MKRVVVTGLGLVTPLGNNVSSTWDAILNGKSGAESISTFPTDDLATTFSASVKNFDVELYMAKKDARKFDPFIQFGIAAAKQAIDDSGITVTEELAPRFGVCIASGIGGMQTIEYNHKQLLEKGPRRVSPFYIPGTIINMVAGQLSIMYGLKGPNISIVTACTTGVHNIGHAARMIAYGDADVMLAGGAEM